MNWRHSKLQNIIEMFTSSSSYNVFGIVTFLSLFNLALTVNRQAGDKYEDQGVKIEILFVPTDCSVKSAKGDILITDYIGTFTDGRKFDSTYDRNESMTYTMGQGDVIKGCEIATMDMCAKEKRRIVIPSALGYGDVQYGQIPPGSILCFDIVLTDLVPDPFKAFGNSF